MKHRRQALLNLDYALELVREAETIRIDTANDCALGYWMTAEECLRYANRIIEDVRATRALPCMDIQ